MRAGQGRRVYCTATARGGGGLRVFYIYRILAINDMTTTPNNQFPHRLSQVAELAAALAHPARIAILELLARRGNCICGEIVDELPLAQSTISQHLAVLKAAGLVKGEIDGPRVCYCIDAARVREMEERLLPLLKKLSRKENKCCV